MKQGQRHTGGIANDTNLAPSLTNGCHALGGAFNGGVAHIQDTKGIKEEGIVAVGQRFEVSTRS